MQPLIDWAESNREILMWVAIASAVFFVASLVVVGVVIVRLPPDHFAKERGEHSGDGDGTKEGGWKEERPSLALALRIGRNIVGWLLILSGIAMLVLPGQGLLVLLIGVMLADFPGKHRLERWIISRGKVLKTINWFRGKFQRPPLTMQPA